MRIRGIVQDGEGDASVRIKEHADVYEAWTGMKLFPGSLNVLLEEKFDWDDASVAPFKRIHSLIPNGGNRDICLVPCEISNDRGRVYGFAWATTLAASDADYRVLEIITSVRLRDVLELENGSSVTIDIPLPWKC
jgi:CTP-dependent riboflavin kinase